MTKKTDFTWLHLKKIWGDQFGITPTEVSALLEKHWLDKGYTVTFGNMFKDKNNVAMFKKYIKYVYEYMGDNEIHWRAALLELFTNKDSFTIDVLIYMNVPHASWKAVTFAKYIGQWRSDFIVKGWLPKDEYSNKPMIKKVKSLTRSLKSKGLLVKKKKK
jgi:hypothetical protein